MQKLPYEDRQEIQDILNHKDWTNEHKANKIYMFDYDMACRMSDGAGVRASMQKDNILNILNDRDLEMSR